MRRSRCETHRWSGPVDPAYPFLCPASFEEPPRRRAARLETKRTHLLTQKHVCGVRYLTTLSASRAPHAAAVAAAACCCCCPVSNVSPPSLYLALLSLLSFSLLLCFCDLFVSASRPIFNFFFFFLPPTFLRLLLRGRSRRPRKPCPPAHTQVHRASQTLLLRRRKKERVGKGKRERAKKITAASHLHARAHLLSTSFAPENSAPVNRPR